MYENEKLLMDIYLKELEDCIMSKTKQDGFSGERWEEYSLNYPRSKIILLKIKQSSERLAKIEVLEELQKAYVNSGLTSHGMRALLATCILELKAGN